VLWLDPTNPEVFPAGLADALFMAETAAAATGADSADRSGGGAATKYSMEERLRAQMRADALLPLDDNEDLPKNADSSGTPPPSPRTIDEAAQFLWLDVGPLSLLSSLVLILFFCVRYNLACGTTRPGFAILARGISLLLLVWHTI
jgi:hypothetical protein